MLLAHICALVIQQCNNMIIYRKSVASELTDERDVAEMDSSKAANLDEQVEKRMQRLNLYFEQENVSVTHY